SCPECSAALSPTAGSSRPRSSPIPRASVSSSWQFSERPRLSKKCEQIGPSRNILSMGLARRSLLMRRTIPALAACVVGYVLSSCVCAAQNNTGELRLSVTDPSGSPVAAAVSILSEAIKTRESVQLPDTGQYSFKNLPFGDYVVAVTAAGFSGQSHLVHIHSVLPQSLNVQMSVQPLQTALQVTESATLVDPDRTAVAYDTGSQEIAE